MTDQIARLRALIATLWELRREADRVSLGAVAHLSAAIAAAEAQLLQQESEQQRGQRNLNYGSGERADDTD